jgi:hypothetical protein
MMNMDSLWDVLEHLKQTLQFGALKFHFSIFHDQWVNQLNYGTTFDSLLLSLSLKWGEIATLSFVTMLAIKGFIQKNMYLTTNNLLEEYGGIPINLWF